MDLVIIVRYKSNTWETILGSIDKRVLLIGQVVGSMERYII